MPKKEIYSMCRFHNYMKIVINISQPKNRLSFQMIHKLESFISKV
jgi:hypothetical protein